MDVASISLTVGSREVPDLRRRRRRATPPPWTHLQHCSRVEPNSNYVDGWVATIRLYCHDSAARHVLNCYAFTFRLSPNIPYRDRRSRLNSMSERPIHRQAIISECRITAWTCMRPGRWRWWRAAASRRTRQRWRTTTSQLASTTNPPRPRLHPLTPSNSWIDTPPHSRWHWNDLDLETQSQHSSSSVSSLEKNLHIV